MSLTIQDLSKFIKQRRASANAARPALATNLTDVSARHDISELSLGIGGGDVSTNLNLLSPTSSKQNQKAVEVSTESMFNYQSDEDDEEEEGEDVEVKQEQDEEFVEQTIGKQEVEEQGEEEGEKNRAQQQIEAGSKDYETPRGSIEASPSKGGTDYTSQTTFLARFSSPTYHKKSTTLM